jgi:hypothetical protein
VLNQRIVKVTTTKVAVVSSRLDIQLPLGEADDRDRVVGVTDIDKADVTLGVRRLGEIRLGDTVAEGDGGGVVDETEGVETGNVGGVNEGAALNVGVPSGDGDDDVRDGLLELCSGNVSQAAEVGSDELGKGEGVGLAKVVDL